MATDKIRHLKATMVQQQDQLQKQMEIMAGNRNWKPPTSSPSPPQNQTPPAQNVKPEDPISKVDSIIC